MTVLGIETATSVCGVALCRDGRIVGRAELDERNIHAEKLFTLVNEAVGASVISLSSVDGVAVSIGPGSFTGLRIGLSAAKGFAWSTGKPLVAVNTLEALACRAIEERLSGDGALVLAAIDARRDEVYCQLFRVQGGALESEWLPRDGHVVEVVTAVGNRSVTVIGDGVGKLRHAAVLQGRENLFVAAPDAFSRCTATTVALLGERLLSRGETVDPVKVEPHYVKDFFEMR